MIKDNKDPNHSNVQALVLIAIVVLVALHLLLIAQGVDIRVIVPITLATVACITAWIRRSR